jgi:hypothetical protein
VLLKKDERVVGLLHIHVMALMVATLIERNLPAEPSYGEDGGHGRMAG